MKNSLIMLATAIFLWVWFPTGPTDLFITFPIIHALGMPTYLALSAVILVLAYFLIDGKNLGDKFNNVVREVKHILR